MKSKNYYQRAIAYGVYIIACVFLGIPSYFAALYWGWFPWLLAGLLILVILMCTNLQSWIDKKIKESLERGIMRGISRLFMGILTGIPVVMISVWGTLYFHPDVVIIPDNFHFYPDGDAYAYSSLILFIIVIAVGQALRILSKEINKTAQQ